jgi:hypothetical protein
VVDSTTTEPVFALFDLLMPAASQTISSEMAFKGAGNGSLSLICRYTAAGWYELGISSGGHWQITRAQTGEGTANLQRTTLAEGDSALITPEKNKIEAACLGDQLSLSVNGELIGSAEDNTVKDGKVIGLLYREDPAGEILAEIDSFVVTDPDLTKVLDLHANVNSYYFYLWKFASFHGAPGDLPALNEPQVLIETDSGWGKISINRPARWIALYPKELPYNVEIAADVDIERSDPYDSYSNHGFGLVCRWSDQPDSQSGLVSGGYVLWIYKEYVIVTPFSVDEFGNAKSNGPAEFSNGKSYVKLLEGNQHHLMARCWNDLVEFYVDGTQVAKYNTSSFPYTGNKKAGAMAGFMFLKGETAPTELNRGYGSPVLIDNLTFSWGVPTATPQPTMTPQSSG